MPRNTTNLQRRYIAVSTRTRKSSFSDVCPKKATVVITVGNGCHDRCCRRRRKGRQSVMSCSALSTPDRCRLRRQKYLSGQSCSALSTPDHWHNYQNPSGPSCSATPDRWTGWSSFTVKTGLVVFDRFDVVDFVDSTPSATATKGASAVQCSTGMAGQSTGYLRPKSNEIEGTFAIGTE